MDQDESSSHSPVWPTDEKVSPPLSGGRQSLLDPAAWATAEAHRVRELARALLALGRLDGVLLSLAEGEMRDGAVSRLALRETEALMWAAGTPLPQEDLGRDMMQARAGTDADVLRGARWAVRRLQGRGKLSDLRDFLGLHRQIDVETDMTPMATRARGRDFDAAAGDFAAGLDELGTVHPLTRAAFGAALWRLSDLSPEGDVVEPACWAARLMAQACLAAPFVPMGHAGRSVRTTGGTPAERLAGWYDAVARGAEEARVILARLWAWRERALRDTATIKGSNPARVIAALAAHPLMTTAMVEDATGVSRDTAERLLARMTGMGLVRETTGARRFRLWAATI